MCKKAKTFAPIFSHSFQLIWMDVGTVLRLVGVMNFILILSPPFNLSYLLHLIFKEENPTFVIWLKIFNVGSYSDIY